jgi:hypothetical protein
VLDWNITNANVFARSAQLGLEERKGLGGVLGGDTAWALQADIESLMETLVSIQVCAVLLCLSVCLSVCVSMETL